MQQNKTNSLKPALLLLVTCLAGCAYYPGQAGSKTCFYFVYPGKDPRTLGRVAMIELENLSSYPPIGPDVTEALYRALQKRQIFSLFVIGRDQPGWESIQFEMDSATSLPSLPSDYRLQYSPKQLSAMRKSLKCNGILIGTVTQYRPYPHMVLGLRLKLIDLRDGKVFWAVEQVWDAEDKATKERIKRYFHSQMQPEAGALGEQLVTVSSLQFLDFVAYEVAATLNGQKRN